MICPDCKELRERIRSQENTIFQAGVRIGRLLRQRDELTLALADACASHVSNCACKACRLAKGDYDESM